MPELKKTTPEGSPMGMNTPVGSALARLRSALDAKPPEVQEDQDRRYRIIMRCCDQAHDSRPRQRRADPAAPFLSALAADVQAIRERNGSKWEHREALAQQVASHLLKTYGKDSTPAAIEQTRVAIRIHGGRAVHRAAVELLRERPKNAEAPIGLLSYRARVWAKRLESNTLHPGDTPSHG
ncbi:MAG: hypothetical protein IT365_11805 [Candidatus Hydrogenedentes bacterium]|nr:hypothetical protein [Candidatus Hydrogenedentota bacterium]